MPPSESVHTRVPPLNPIVRARLVRDFKTKGKAILVRRCASTGVKEAPLPHECRRAPFF